MKREISYRDKMILLIIAVIVILVGGFFLLIKPKYSSYVKDKATYEETKTTWDGIDQKLQAIDPLEKSITKNRDEAAKTAEIFVNSLFATSNDTFENKMVYYDVEKYFQKVLDESNLNVTELDLGEIETTTISYSYYEPDVLTYALLEAGDINGNYAYAAAEVMLESIVLSASEDVELMAEQVSITVEGKKEGLLKFLDAIAASEDAILVTGVEIEDYAFQGGQTSAAEGQAVSSTNGDGTSVMTLTLSLYNAKEIDNPDFSR